MDHHGFIHEKLDIKLLILYILSRLSAPVDRGTLDELCQQCDDGIGYFDYSDCLGELMQTGHIVCDDEEYAITDKGLHDCSEVETRLPYSVRSRAMKLIAPVEERLARAAKVRTEIAKEKKFFRVRLAMSDDRGEVLSMSLLCEDEAQAKTMKRGFRRNAEEICRQISEILCEKGT